MRPIALACLLLLSAAATARAGDDDGPVCGRPMVLQLVAETLRRAGQPVAIQPHSASQAPTGDPGLVRCAVLVRTRSYDTGQAGGVPLDRLSVFAYSLELRRNGIFLRPGA